MDSPLPHTPMFDVKYLGKRTNCLPTSSSCIVGTARPTYSDSNSALRKDVWPRAKRRDLDGLLLGMRDHQLTY